MKKVSVIKSIILVLILFTATCVYLLYSSTKVDSEVGSRDVEVQETITHLDGNETHVEVVAPQIVETPKTGLIARVSQKIEEKKETFVDKVL
ncbi:hypothetical protein IT409_01320, partial [Candidatus Falkowbacteria bacterium]|nr:hypothetical protein [Candidatus Falkowbacteria bacterium]